MDPQPVERCPDTYLVDNEMFGMEGTLATYLLDAEQPVVLDANLATIDRLHDLEPERVLFSHFGPGGDGTTDLDDTAEVLPQWVDAIRDARADTDDLDGLVQRLPPEWQSPTLRRDVVGVLQYLDEG